MSVIQKALLSFYLRVSDVNNPQSLDNQVADAESYRVGRGLLTSEIRLYTDLGSGKQANVGLEQMLRDVESGLISEIVVRDLSRLFRNIEQFLRLLNMLEKYQVKLISLKEGIDGSTAMGRALIQFVGVMAELERTLTIERTQAGLLRARMQGRIGGRRKGQVDKKPRSKRGYYLRYAKVKNKSVLDKFASNGKAT